MAKLTGAKKAAFLRRMAKGRKAAQNKRKPAKKTSLERTLQRNRINRVRKSATRKRKSTTLKRTRSTTKTMRRKTSRRSSAKRGISSVFKSGLLGKAAAGIGAATVMSLIVSNVAPQFTPISNVAGGYLGGGAVGSVAALAVNGGLGNISQIFGGQSSGNTQVMGV